MERPNLNNALFFCIFNLSTGPLKACIFAHSTAKLALHLTPSHLLVQFTERQYYMYSKINLLLRRSTHISMENLSKKGPNFLPTT